MLTQEHFDAMLAQLPLNQSIQKETMASFKTMCEIHRKQKVDFKIYLKELFKQLFSGERSAEDLQDMVQILKILIDNFPENAAVAFMGKDILPDDFSKLLYNNIISDSKLKLIIFCDILDTIAVLGYGCLAGENNLLLKFLSPQIYEPIEANKDIEPFTSIFKRIESFIKTLYHASIDKSLLHLHFTEFPLPSPKFPSLSPQDFQPSVWEEICRIKEYAYLDTPHVTATILHHAVLMGDIQFVKNVLDQGVAINQAATNGFLAIDYSHPALLKTPCHNHQWEIDVRDHYKESHDAIESLLLARGSKKPYTSSYHNQEKTIEAALSEMADRIPNTKLKQEQMASYKQSQSETKSKVQSLYSLQQRPYDKNITPYTVKSKLSWDILADRTNRYFKSLSQKPPNHKLQVSIGDTNFSIPTYDFRTNQDYRFIVNTIKTNPQALQEILTGEPDFINTAFYISCSLIDDETAACEGSHQINSLFPIQMILSAPSHAIAYTADQDIGSPYDSEKDKPQYLQEILSTSHALSTLQAQYQAQSHLKTLNKKDSSHYFPPSPYAVEAKLKTHPEYINARYKHPGRLPHFSVDSLQRLTDHGYYNEIVVLGNNHNIHTDPIQTQVLVDPKGNVEVTLSCTQCSSVKVNGLVINEELFNKQMLRIQENYKFFKEFESQGTAFDHIFQSLKLLEKSPLPILFTNTDKNAYKNKRPMHQRLSEVLKKQKINQALITYLLAKQQRNSVLTSEEAQYLSIRLIESQTLKEQAQLLFEEYSPTLKSAPHQLQDSPSSLALSAIPEPECKARTQSSVK